MVSSVALPYDKGQIFTDFDKCNEFIIYVFDGNNACYSIVFGIAENKFINLNNKRLKLLLHNNIHTVICDKISKTTKQNLEKFSITVIDGVSGSAEAAFEDYKSRRMKELLRNAARGRYRK